MRRTSERERRIVLVIVQTHYRLGVVKTLQVITDVKTGKVFKKLEKNTHFLSRNNSGI